MVGGQTLRHLIFVHDSWFRRCCRGSTDLFTPMGIGPSVEPYRQAHGIDLALEPSLDEVATVRQAQAAELESWLESVTPEQLAATAPVPDDDVWPPYARGRTMVLPCRQMASTVTAQRRAITAANPRRRTNVSGDASQRFSISAPRCP